MKRSWLIQRLYKSFPGDFEFPAFGGGLRWGGLTKKDAGILRKIWRFDYMGSAEFEFGAIPKCLNTLWDNRRHYVYGEVVLHYNHVGWNDRQKFSGERKVYFICKEDDVKEVKQRLAKWALGEPAERAKERICLSEGMAMMGKEGNQYCGWLEIDNQFMFFTDQQMFLNVSYLFEIDHPVDQKEKNGKQ